MDVSEFHIKKMDCASEENIIRMQLQSIREIEALDFDIANRKLRIYHKGNLSEIESTIHALNFNATHIKTDQVRDEISPSHYDQRSLLWKVLIINAVFFIIEILAGLVSNSMGLVADSLDMLADAAVYGLSLFAVGGTLRRQKQVAGLSGYFQLALAIAGFGEVVRRFLGYAQLPNFKTMIIVSILALIANVVCLYLLQKSKSEEAHMKASLIFTSNDIIINLGVVIAGVLVLLLNSAYPDLIIGAIVFIIVTRGALSILKLAK